MAKQTGIRESNADSYISRMREKVVKELEETGQRTSRPCERNDDIDQNIRSIRAILAMNAEIFDRVIESMKYDTDQGSVFTRYGFEVVKVQKVESMVQFSTYPESSEITFDLTPLKTAPGVLGMLQPMHKVDFQSFIDYESFFERSLGLLHEDVLCPFLGRLQDHLELIQVCLGEVDSWLMDSQSNIEFLEGTFFGDTKKKLGLQGDAVVYKSDTGDAFVAGTDRCLSNELCLHCNSLFDWHKKCVIINGYYHRRCVSPPQRSGHVDGLPRFYSFPEQQVLKECAVDGRFEATFNISQGASEQIRLLKLLEFMSC